LVPTLVGATIVYLSALPTQMTEKISTEKIKKLDGMAILVEHIEWHVYSGIKM
jgi:hypothetical protein